MKNISRRSLIRNGALAGVGISLLPRSARSSESWEWEKQIRVGIVGTGVRGTGLMRTLLSLGDVEITALCDINRKNLENAAAICVEKGLKKPAAYGYDDYIWRELLNHEKIDAVIIATPWAWHVPVALHAMQRGIYPGVEVPAALTVEDCWQLTETSEKTGIPCMMLENWSFRRDNLSALNMMRAGLFGQIVHSHCAHSHDCIDHWFFDSKTGNPQWPARYLLEYNRDQYPTHSVGPVLSWLDINCGDVITEVYSTATASKGINAYIERTFGKDHPNAKLNYKQGDIVTSLLKTKKGKTIVINYDMQLPRPYSNRWMLQGTLGIYDEEKASVYLAGKSPEYHQWERWKPYEEKHLHKWWQEGSRESSHGGADYIMLREFIRAVREKGSTPLDVYDSVVMSAIVELSGISIQKRKPVNFPDFTKGKWESRPPYFAI